MKEMYRRVAVSPDRYLSRKAAEDAAREYIKENYGPGIKGDRHFRTYKDGKVFWFEIWMARGGMNSCQRWT